MSLTKTTDVLAEVLIERGNQETKWGEQNHRCDLYYTILGEEVGEVGKAICEYLILNHGSIADIRMELIQVAAVAVAMVECLDRNGK
jgi:NTP pyrophosphatase (non-canonical NTP hydrolase)